MRKYLIGFVAGALLTVSATVFAEEISKVGKVIDAEFIVKLNGKELPVKAVAFEGTSYAPVRAIGENLGLVVDFKDGEVILEQKKEVKPVPEGESTETEESLKKEIYKLEDEMILQRVEGGDRQKLDQIETKLAELRKKLAKLQGKIVEPDKEPEKPAEPGSVEAIKAEIEKLVTEGVFLKFNNNDPKRLAEIEARVAELRLKLAELEAAKANK